MPQLCSGQIWLSHPSQKNAKDGAPVDWCGDGSPKARSLHTQVWSGRKGCGGLRPSFSSHVARISCRDWRAHVVVAETAKYEIRATLVRTWGTRVEL
jgi:hypothetical protein